MGFYLVTTVGNHTWYAGGASLKMTLLANGTLGIGTSSPTELLHLQSIGPARLLIEADTNNVTESDNAQIILKQDASLVIGRLGYQTSTNSLEVWNEFSEHVIFGTSNTERMRITSGGQIQTPANPAFRARAKSAQTYAAGWQHVLYDESVTSRGTGYANSRFTAPVDGWYQFNAQWTASNNADVDGTLSIWINGSASNLAASVSMPTTGPNYDGHTLSGCCYLAATHYVQVHRYSSVSNITRSSAPYGGWFSGFLIG